MRWALAGIVYAYFLNPADLLVSEDPLLLRKHQFITLDQGLKNTHVFEPASFNASSDKAGSYFIGGFAEFADAAGSAAAMSAKLGGEYGEMFAGKQIGAIRSTNWESLRDEDLRLLGLKVAVAREWIVRAAQQSELEASLAEATFGLLSLTRRAELLGALSDGNLALRVERDDAQRLVFSGRALPGTLPGGPLDFPRHASPAAGGRTQ